LRGLLANDDLPLAGMQVVEDLLTQLFAHDLVEVFSPVAGQVLDLERLGQPLITVSDTLGRYHPNSDDCFWPRLVEMDAAFQIIDLAADFAADLGKELVKILNADL